MALSSMTGFSRSSGVSGAFAWSWEIKSVNAKGLDLRLRLPPGWDAIEPAIRARAAQAMSRGTVYATLAVERRAGRSVVRINEDVLAAVLAALKSLEGRVQAEPPRLDGILAIKGVMEIAENEDSEDDRVTAEAAASAGFETALDGLAQMRRHEGAALGALLSSRLGDVIHLVERAERNPGRQPDAVKRRIAEQLANLLDAGARLDSDRLHQEALLLASKADIREELDRLIAHVNQAERLIEQGGPVGRRLDFLSQELNRETNTLCAKSNDIELTNTGLELKSVVEQFREQVQNLE